MYAAKKARVLRVEARRRPAVVAGADPSPWDWYAGSCTCGLPPGDCRAHPRARPSQRPPASDWRVWAYVAGRGAGKTRAGACWVQHRAEAGIMKLGCLIAPTKADIRDVMVEGPSGLLAVAPPWCRPRFEPSKRRVVWPTGARAVCLSGEEPERARGLNVDTLWADELACWQRAESTWDLAMLALRAGTDPRAMITTTPRRVAVEEYERVFGSRLVARWPGHLVLDGLEALDLLLESGNLLIHPRCTQLKAAFQTYSRQRRRGEWIDYPADGHPEEDMIDALRGGVRDAFPQGLVPQSEFRRLHASWAF
jgi:Terminase large subunit, T4likevirus-type, N-terminal